MTLDAFKTGDKHGIFLEVLCGVDPAGDQTIVPGPMLAAMSTKDETAASRVAMRFMTGFPCIW